MFIICRLTLHVQAINTRRMRGKDMERRGIYTKFQKDNLPKDNTMEMQIYLGG
jgi:hypothetical protein